MYTNEKAFRNSCLISVIIFRPHIEVEKKWPPFSRWHFQMHFLEWRCINSLIKISMKFLPKGPINNIPALVQIMAWRRPGDRPLSEPMMVSFFTHICDSRPQWVKIQLLLLLLLLLVLLLLLLLLLWKVMQGCCQMKHNDIINWRHFPRYWPFVRGIHRSPVNSTHKGH